MSPDLSANSGIRSVDMFSVVGSAIYEILGRKPREYEKSEVNKHVTFQLSIVSRHYR